MMEEEDEFGDLYSGMGSEIGMNHGEHASPNFESDEDDEEMLYGNSARYRFAPGILPSKVASKSSFSEKLCRESQEDGKLSLCQRDPDCGLGVSVVNKDVAQKPESRGSIHQLGEIFEGTKAIDARHSERTVTGFVDPVESKRLLANGASLSQNSVTDVTLPSSDGLDFKQDSQSCLPKSSMPTRLVLQNREGSPDVDDLTDHTAAIPGLSTCGVIPEFVPEDFEGVKGEEWEGRESGRRDLTGHGGLTRNESAGWDSDSEDDLQIVLNDNHPLYSIFEREAGGNADEDEVDLVIVAGDEPIQEQEWSEDQSLTLDGVKSISGDRPLAVSAEKQIATTDEKGYLGKGVVTVGTNQGATRMGYGSHGYHHHSQYKYVRTGGTAVSGMATTSSGQVEGTRIALGRGGGGRGDWSGSGRRPYGSQRVPQVPSWGSGSSHGFLYGYEFTLPPTKTVFDIDVDSLEEKPWRLPTVDTTDFFNFGFNESSWKDYCKQLAQLRLETTMQSKIRVYESGWSEQEYDPDLPPELAAAAGLHEISGENTQRHQIEADASATASTVAGHARGVGRGRAQVLEQKVPLSHYFWNQPAGQAIQVEEGLGERPPSADTRRQRIRDFDAIILHEPEDLVEAQDADKEAREELEEEEELEGEDEELDEVNDEEELEPEPEPEPEQQKALCHEDHSPSQEIRGVSRKSGGSSFSISHTFDGVEPEHGADVGAVPCSQGPGMQATEAESGPVATTLLGESLSTPVDWHKIPRPLTPVLTPPQGRREMEVDRSHSSDTVQEFPDLEKMKFHDGYGRIDADSLDRERSLDIPDHESFHEDQNLEEVSTGQGSDERKQSRSQDVLAQDDIHDDVHCVDLDLLCSQKRLSLSSHDDLPAESSPLKQTDQKYLGHSGELSMERFVDDKETLESRKHVRHAIASREGICFSYEEDVYPPKREESLCYSIHQMDREAVSHRGKIDEHRRRSKEENVGKGKAKEQYIDRDEKEFNTYVRNKEREEDPKKYYFRKEEENKQRERDNFMSLPDSRRKKSGEERKRGRLDREHRVRQERDDKLLRWHRTEEHFRRNKEGESRRGERSNMDEGGHEWRQRNKYVPEQSESEHDLYLRKREEERRRGKLEGYRQWNGRRDAWRERENAHQRKGTHEDSHGRRNKDETAAKIGQNRLRTEESQHREHENYRKVGLRPVSNNRDRARERHKYEEQRNDRDYLEDLGEGKGRFRHHDLEVSRLEGKQIANEGNRSQHGHFVLKAASQGQRLQNDGRKLDVTRNKQADAERNSLHSYGKCHHDHDSKKRKADDHIVIDQSDKFSRKNSGDLEKGIIEDSKSVLKAIHREKSPEQVRKMPDDDAVHQKFSARDDSPQVVDFTASSEDDPNHIGQSMLQQCVRQRDSEPSDKLPVEDEMQNKVDSICMTFQQDITSSSEKDNFSNKNGDATLDDNRKVDVGRKPREELQYQVEGEWDMELDGMSTRSEYATAGKSADSKSVGDDQWHFQQHLKQQLDMVAKLEKRKERFKIPIAEDKELRMPVESGSNQAMDRDEAKAERPARKRRWGNG